jgi:hypothetical protein
VWLFTSESFLSLVSDRDSTDKLLVRARIIGHIESLFPQANVFQLDSADYLQRALVSREDVQKVVARQVESISYDNFKNSISDAAYLSACHKVWREMHRLQEV